MKKMMLIVSGILILQWGNMALPECLSSSFSKNTTDCKDFWCSGDGCATPGYWYEVENDDSRYSCDLYCAGRPGMQDEKNSKVIETGSAGKKYCKCKYRTKCADQSYWASGPDCGGNWVNLGCIRTAGGYSQLEVKHCVQPSAADAKVACDNQCSGNTDVIISGHEVNCKCPPVSLPTSMGSFFKGGW